MFRISAYHHVGIRVTDENRAIDFYAVLGFQPEPGCRWPEHDAIALINDDGLRINLIYNGKVRDSDNNVLLDEPEKWPGITHVAFQVPDLDAVVEKMNSHGIRITEGPEVIGDQRRICFVRDPDGNVIEFDELVDT